MIRACSQCKDPATFSCSCMSYPEGFCSAHLLNHVQLIKQPHWLEHLSQPLCQICNLRNVKFTCKCKGEQTELCNNCILSHITKTPYASHELKKNK